MNEVKVVISQSSNLFGRSHLPSHTELFYTEDVNTQLNLNIYAAFGLVQYFNYCKAFTLKLYLSKPILVETFFNGKCNYRFTQYHYKQGQFFDEKREIVFPLNNGLYVLRDENKVNSTTQTRLPNYPISGVNFSSLLNTIEYQQQKIKKINYPVIYTGMTN